MKYKVKNLRTNKVEYFNEELDYIECYIKISVKFKNEYLKLDEKRWTKKDFEILEVIQND